MQGSHVDDIDDLLDFVPVDGGADRACRGASANDNSASYYLVISTASLRECKEQCVQTSGCQGIEFKGSRCEIWTRPEGIGATANVSGFSCLRYLGGSTTSPAPATTTEATATTTTTTTNST